MNLRLYILVCLSLVPSLAGHAAVDSSALEQRIEELRSEAAKLDEARDFQGSLAANKEALALAREAKDEWAQLDFLREAAGSAVALKLTPLAKSYFDEAMLVADHMGSQHAKAMNRRLEAIGWAALGYRGEARKAAGEALAFKRQDELTQLDLADYLLEAAEADLAAEDPAFALLRLGEIKQGPGLKALDLAYRHRYEMTRARALQDLGQDDQALAAFQAAVTTAKNLEDTSKLAQALVALAQQQEGSDSEESYRSLLALGEKQKDPFYMAYAQVKLAELALDAGSLAMARQRLLLANQALDTEENLDFRSSLWIQQARLSLKEGDVGGAQGFLEQAILLSQQRGHCDDEVEAGLVMSRGLQALKQMGQALAASRSAVQKARDCRLKDLLPKALNELGNLAADLGLNSEARAALDESRKAALDAAGFAKGQRLMMDAYWAQISQSMAVSDYLSALEAAEQGLLIARGMGSGWDKSKFLVKEGDALRKMGRTAQAIQAYEAALAVDLNEMRDESQAYVRLVVEYHLAGLKGDQVQKRVKLVVLMERAQALGLDESWAKMSHDLANLCLEQGQTQEAMAATVAGLEKIKLAEGAYLFPVVAADLWDAQGRAWLSVAESEAGQDAKRHALLQAEQALRASVALDDEIRANIDDEEGRIQFNQERLETRDRLTDCLLQLHKLEDDLTWLDRALAEADYGKARLLAEQLQDSRARRSAGLPRKEAQQLRQLEARVAELEVELAKAQVKGGAKRTRKAWMDARAQRQALRQQLKGRFPAYAAMKEPPRLDLQSLRQRLGPKEALLEMAALNGKLVLWWVSRTALEVRVLADAGPFDSMADQYQTRLSKAKLEPDLELGLALTDLIFGAWQGRLARLQRLYVVADGKAVGLPLQALPSARLGHYLLEDLEFTYLQSAALLQPRPKAAGSWDMGLFVLGNPDLPHVQTRLAQARGMLRGNDPGRNVARFFDELKDLETLEGAEAEAIALQQLAPERSTLLLKSKALESTVKRSSQQGHLAGYRYLHFASHGMLCDSEPQLSSLVLASDKHDDGLLSAGEVLGLNLRSDLVTLSACELGLGKQLRGEGTLGMTRAFMGAGAATVVVSLWAVYDNATRELMLEFYQGLARGQSKSAALRSAQLSLLKGGQWAKPVYWAPFVLYGAAE